MVCNMIAVNVRTAECQIREPSARSRLYITDRTADDRWAGGWAQGKIELTLAHERDTAQRAAHGRFRGAGVCDQQQKKTVHWCQFPRGTRR